MIKYYTGIGSRKYPPFDNTIDVVADELHSLGYTLRSGGAEGADTAFEKATYNKEIYLPWKGFNKNDSELILGSDKLNNAKAWSIAKMFHPKFSSLTNSSKKLIVRNSFQVFGKQMNSPSEFVVCWTVDGKDSGGTGQAIRIARAHNIPVFNLADKNNGLERYLEWTALTE